MARRSEESWTEREKKQVRELYGEGEGAYTVSRLMGHGENGRFPHSAVLRFVEAYGEKRTQREAFDVKLWRPWNKKEPRHESA